MKNTSITTMPAVAHITECCYDQRSIIFGASSYAHRYATAKIQYPCNIQPTLSGAYACGIADHLLIRSICSKVSLYQILLDIRFVALISECDVFLVNLGIKAVFTH